MLSVSTKCCFFYNYVNYHLSRIEVNMHASPPHSSHWSCQVLFVSFEFVGSKAVSSLYITILNYGGLHLL